MTWSSTFRRFPPGPMTVFGPITLGVHDWAAPRPGQPQMFNHPFLEWFTGTRPRTLVLIFLPVRSAAPPGLAVAAFGYLAYDLLHYASHAVALRGRVPRFLRQHHLTHHYRMPETRFGVSSPFWDRVFGTLR